jgi:hypothetical protein
MHLLSNALLSYPSDEALSRSGRRALFIASEMRSSHPFTLCLSTFLPPGRQADWLYFGRNLIINRTTSLSASLPLFFPSFSFAQKNPQMGLR